MITRFSTRACSALQNRSHAKKASLSVRIEAKRQNLAMGLLLKKDMRQGKSGAIDAFMFSPFPRPFALVYLFPSTSGVSTAESSTLAFNRGRNIAFKTSRQQQEQAEFSFFLVPSSQAVKFIIAQSSD
jgi:hypothetical protein